MSVVLELVFEKSKEYSFIYLSVNPGFATDKFLHKESSRFTQISNIKI